VWQADGPVTPEELQSIADGVVERAAPGEELEAVVTWSRETEIRAFEGEVEHFVSADSAGVGVRIIRDGRQGLAWAGVLDGESLDSVVDDARDNARFGTPDPDAGLAEPDGHEVAVLDLYDARVLDIPTEEKIRLAVDLERLTVSGDPRMSGVESSDYADAVVASAISSTAGVRASGRESSVYAGVYALAGGDGDTTSGFGFTVGRAAEDLDIATAASDAVTRCVDMLGARKAPSRRLTVVLTPYVTSQFLGLVAESGRRSPPRRSRCTTIPPTRSPRRRRTSTTRASLAGGWT
jgi:PmbA protein